MSNSSNYAYNEMVMVPKEKSFNNNSSIAKKSFGIYYSEYAQEIDKQNKIITEEKCRLEPADYYNYLMQVDSMMLRGISNFESVSGKQIADKIYPALWADMRSVLAKYLNDVNNCLSTCVSVMVAAMIEADSLSNTPIQQPDERPQLSQEDQEKGMINAERPEMPNCMKNPYIEPDSKIIDVNPYFDGKTADEIITESISVALEQYKEMTSNELAEEDINIIKAVYDSADKYKDAIALGSISLNECDELGGIVTKLFEEKLDINDGRNIDNKYTDIKQVIQWTIFKMPKPMEDMIMQQYKIQQQMEAQHVFDSVKAVQDSDGAVSPVGGKGPGSLRVVKK